VFTRRGEEKVLSRVKDAKLYGKKDMGAKNFLCSIIKQKYRENSLSSWIVENAGIRSLGKVSG
jgi:hypothetical protein